MSKSASATNYSRAIDAVLDVRKITPAIGAEIRGERLSGDLPTATAGPRTGDRPRRVVGSLE